MKKRFLIFALLPILAVGGDYYYNEKVSRDITFAVKSGEATLYCAIGSDFKKIDPEKIINFKFDLGWTFTNGAAKNCEVVYER